MKRFSISTAVTCLLLFAVSAVAQISPSPAQPPAGLSRAIGTFYAPSYAYGLAPGSTPGRVVSGNSATGSQTITLQQGIVTLPDGRTDMPYAVDAPILIGNGTNAETVTPSAVSGCYEVAILSGSQGINCTVTATFSNLHGQGEIVQSGSYGLQEAINDAFSVGGGKVVVDQWWAGGFGSPLVGTTSTITSAVPFQSVYIEDDRFGSSVNWTPGTTQVAASYIATPSTLTSTTVGFGINGANTTGGTYTGASTYHACVAYVDVMGNEGACSADFSGLTAGTGSTNQIGFSAPAASAGAVGYTVYISLAGGSYALAYQVPITSSVCTLTKIETVTPACTVTNTTYNQTGSNAVVSALTVNTSPLALQLGGVAGQLGTGNSNAHTTYAYLSGGHVGPAGITTTSLPFTAASGTLTSTTQVVLGTVAIPAGLMNLEGKTIRICGKAQLTPSSSTTIENLQVYWDGAGSDTAGSPVQLANLISNATFTAAAYNNNFCETFTTSVSGAGVTAGSILGGAALNTIGLASAGTTNAIGTDTKTAAVGSLNLAGGGGFTSRIHIVQTHTTGTDTAAQLVNLTVEVL